ncbi:MAG: VRR-NUC domain-containing protein [Lachnospiraceae bacterium]|nr:VRR-NUC domain-containing protein [bacterium]MDY5518466.1 VRR-NUC domain-containing protein [Lachnospiraceae bacterium]
MLESDVEKILVDTVRGLGGRSFKWVSPGNAGVPDRIVILPDRKPIFVELKTDTGQLTRLQKVQIGRLRNLGQDVRVVKGLSGVAEFFGDIGYPDVEKKIMQRKGSGKDGIHTA